MKKRIKQISSKLLLGLTLIMFFAFLLYKPAQAAVFKDMGTEDDSLPYINYLVQKNIIQGFPDGNFHPQGEITRAQMAQMLMKACGNSPSSTPSVSFSDVSPQHWAYNAINVAVQTGYIKGYPDGTFRPEAPASRAEVATMLLRITSEDIPDISIPDSVKDINNHWASLQVSVALDANIMELTSPGKFSPDQPANRAEVARGLAIMLILDPGSNKINITGTLVVINGQVQITKATGEQITVSSANSSLCTQGDTIVTGPYSSAHLKFPDGSGFDIKENTSLIIKEARGCETILQDGKPGAKIDYLEVGLSKGQIFGALASTSQSTEIKTQAWVLDREHPLLLASLGTPPLMLASASQNQLPWYNQSEKKVRVKVDMPWGVAAIRGTFWMNWVGSNQQSTNVVEGQAEVTSGGQTIPVSAGYSTTIGSASAPPAPPVLMTLQQRQQWNNERDWFQQTAQNIHNLAPLTLQQGTTTENNPSQGAEQIINDINHNINVTTGQSSSSGSSGHTTTYPATAPTASPAAGTYSTAQSVCLSSTTEGATIYYTLDGSDPTTSNTRSIYSDAISIEETTTIKACAVKDGMTASDAISFTYTIDIQDADYSLGIIELSRMSVNNYSEQTTSSNIAHSDSPWLSADGRYMVFHSYANNLILGDTNNSDDIFVKDTLYGVVTRVSVTTSGIQANGGACDQPRITPDGRYVVFRSGSTNLATGDPADDTNGNWDVFVHDRDTDGNAIFDEAEKIMTRRVSVTSSGEQAAPCNMGNSFPSISNNGRFVCFASQAANLAEGANGMLQIYVHDRDVDEDEIFDEEGAVATLQVSVSNAGIQGDNDCYYPEISGDGRYVVFTSASTNLVSGLVNQKLRIYIHDLVNHTTSYLTEGSDPQISNDGNYITFSAYDTQQVDSNDINQASDIYILNRSTGNIKRISSNSDTGVQANADCNKPYISPDGRFVTFYSGASNLVPGDNNDCYDAFIYDQQNQYLKRLNITRLGLQANYDIYEVSPVSASGDCVAFTTEASNLVDDDTNEEDDIFLVRFNPNASAADPPPVENIYVYNNVSGDDYVMVRRLPDNTIVKVYDATGDGNLIGYTTVIEGGAWLIIEGGFPNNLICAYVSITPSAQMESNRTAKAIPMPPCMVEGTDYEIDNTNCGYGKLEFKVTASQKSAMEAATDKHIAFIKVYVTSINETTFDDLADAEASEGVTVSDEAAVFARDPGLYGYAIAAYDDSNQVVAYYVSETWEIVY